MMAPNKPLDAGKPEVWSRDKEAGEEFEMPTRHPGRQLATWETGKICEGKDESVLGGGSTHHQSGRGQDRVPEHTCAGREGLETHKGRGKRRAWATWGPEARGRESSRWGSVRYCLSLESGHTG